MPRPSRFCTHSPESDGARPNGVIVYRVGNLYGTALNGGSTNCHLGCGTAFKLTHRNSGWIFATLYTFQNGADGAAPTPPTIGPDGSLYGAAGAGGINGGGTIFNLKPPSSICPTVQCAWTEHTIYSFPNDPLDGANPLGPLVFDSTGNLYGPTFLGGEQCVLEAGCGTVFELSPVQGQWVETRRNNFIHSTSAQNPVGIALDTHGNVVGVSMNGGFNGVGAVFKLVPTENGWADATLLSLALGDQGAYPQAGITLHDGNIFGTTGTYGFNNGGTTWELICCNWNFQLLYSFSYSSLGINGVGPSSNLVFDAAGNIYGTTKILGAYGNGNVYKLTPTGGGNYAYSSLYDFTGGDDGSNPQTNIAIDGSGNLYGTASNGGAHHYGVVWEITQ
jgi:hypothetical protein